MSQKPAAPHNIKVYPDIHGSWDWCQSYRNPNFEKLIATADHHVFLGDYVDSFTAHSGEIVDVLSCIMEFKRLFPDRVTLLLGNHDLNYLWNYTAAPGSSRRFMCSGHRPEMDLFLGPILAGGYDKKIFTLAYRPYPELKLLFTHAGVTQNWLGIYQRELRRVFRNIDILEMPLEDQLNFALSSERFLALFDIVGRDFNGSSPVWAWASETEMDMIPGWVQIVGHTAGKQKRQLAYGEAGAKTFYMDYPDSYKTTTFSREILTELTIR